jgi:hypothetical protein
MTIIRVSVLFIILTAFSFQPASTTLEYKFKAGDTYEWKQSTQQSMKQTVPGAGEMNTDTKTETGLIIKILEKTPTGAKAEVILPKIKVETKSAMIGNITLDSDGDQSVDFNKILKSITTTVVIAYISKSGAVEKFEGVEKFQENLASLGLGEATKPMAKQIADQFTSQGSLKSNLEQALIQYPSGKVSIGDTWKTTTAAPLNIPIRIENTWKLSAIESKTASIENDGLVMTSDSDKEFSANGFRAKANMTGRVAAKSKADLQTGWPQEIKLISEMKGTITVLAGNGIPQDMEIPTEIVTESQQTVAKK